MEERIQQTEVPNDLKFLFKYEREQEKYLMRMVKIQAYTFFSGKFALQEGLLFNALCCLKTTCPLKMSTTGSYDPWALNCHASLYE